MAKKNIPIDGQLNLFDLLENAVVINQENPICNMKIEPLVNKNIGEADIVEKYIKEKDLNRIIHYCGGGYGIELRNIESYETIYLNSLGEEEFRTKKKHPVLPMDKILTTNIAVNLNDLQQSLLSKMQDDCDKVIKRKGDENILLEYENKCVSITPKGWVLEFSAKALYTDEEIILNNTTDLKDNKKLSVEDLKTGDKVLVKYGEEICKGVVINKHHTYDAFSINFNKKNTKTVYNTTFHIGTILEKLN